MNARVHLIDYIATHWRGQQPLARAFWINLVLLRTALFLAQRLLRPADGENHADHALVVMTLAVLVHGVVFVWQVVGAVRAAETHLVGSGDQAPTWGTYLGCALLLWLTIAFSLESWQMTQRPPEEERFAVRMERLRAERYTLSVDSTATQLYLRGTIELGVTRRVEALLKRTPSIERMTLESPGGNVFEARGLARLYREYELASHVEVLCASACTTAFISGTPRTISATARLGFHQYRLEDNRTSIIGGAAQAQRRDQTMFTEAGVDPRFVQRMFEQTSSGMWWPTKAELEAAGVVDRVTEPGTSKSDGGESDSGATAPFR